MTHHYQKTQFLLSAARINQLPADTGIEVAIVGRSNAGKSSTLNRITQSKNLARVSNTPGRTQMINVFQIDDDRRLIDLPGYGYAKVPLAAKEQWQQQVDAYITTRNSLKGLILVMDIRHLFKELDLKLLEYCDHRHLPVHVLLNKADKLSKNETAKAKHEVNTALKHYQNPISYQVFSAQTGNGIKELHTLLNSWYHFA